LSHDTPLKPTGAAMEGVLTGRDSPKKTPGYPGKPLAGKNDSFESPHDETEKLKRMRRNADAP